MAFFPERLQTTKELITREGTAIAAGNNVDPANSSFLRITSGTSLTGLAGGISGYELTLINATAAAITLAHNSASSSAGNKLVTPTAQDVSLQPGAAIILKYSSQLLSGAGGWQVATTPLGTQPVEAAAIAAGNNVALSWGDFVRITSGTSLTGLAGGTSGYQLTLINATAGDVTIANNSASSSAGNKIVTGTGGDIALPTGAALYLKYSANLLSGAGAWQVVGGVAGGYKTSLAQSLAAGGTPTIGTQPFQRIKVQGNAAAVSMATTLAGGTDGMTLLFIGNDSTNTVTIAQNDASNGFILNGDVVLSKYSTLLVQYDSATSRWVEISRNQIASYV